MAGPAAQARLRDRDLSADRERRAFRSFFRRDSRSYESSRSIFGERWRLRSVDRSKMERNWISLMTWFYLPRLRRLRRSREYAEILELVSAFWNWFFLLWRQTVSKWKLLKSNLHRFFLLSRSRRDLSFDLSSVSLESSRFLSFRDERFSFDRDRRLRSRDERSRERRLRSSRDLRRGLRSSELSRSFLTWIFKVVSIVVVTVVKFFQYFKFEISCSGY